MSTPKRLHARLTASSGPTWPRFARKLRCSVFAKRWTSSTLRTTRSMPNFSPPSLCARTTSSMRSHRPTRVLSVRLLSRCPTSRGQILAASRMSSSSSASSCSTLWSTRKSSKSSAWHPQRACCSMALRAAARPCWPRPWPTSAKPTSCPSRDPSCSRCGSASQRQMCARSSKRRARPRHVCSSSTSSTRSPSRVGRRSAMLAAPAIAS
mmetsp:Transcript_147679/g.358428  ORF Transcript_147679/g.358428 Transcript_147679/m.358428 type:complete len:209 (-) Transcript_147679:590-1216(-)